MGIFDFLSTSGSKHLPAKKLEKMLREMHALSTGDREYIKGVFSRYESGGVSKDEAMHAIHTLLEDMHDRITHEEAEKVKMKILSFFV
jgi:hypothetical protein